MAKDTKPKTVYYTKKHQEMFQEIMEEKGYPTFSAVAHQAIIYFHGSIFKDYVGVRKKGMEIKTPRAEQRKETKAEEQMAMCTALKGKVKNSETGNPVCVYYNYQSKNRFEQEVPVDMLEDMHVARQYQPTKEKVEQLVKEGKVNY